VFSPDVIQNLDLSINYWSIRIENGVASPSSLYIVNNPQQFPGRITRAAPTPGDPYPVGPIISIDQTKVNFGFLNEAGIDFGINWHTQTSLGEFSPSLAATMVSHYVFQFDPASPPQNAVSQANDQTNYAPRWKGTIGLGWKKHLLALGVTGLYTGTYKDVQDLTPTPRSLGNFWYVNFNGRYELGRELAPNSPFWSSAFIAAGVNNLGNKLPPYSDYAFGSQGYDPYQYNLLGRFIWAQVGLKF